MNRLRLSFAVVVAAWLLAGIASSQEVRHEISFPDPPGYITLKCDLHMHTVFSDGLVWPTVRVSEAWRQGLDAISITDHIEYQPHRADVPTKHNRPFELAAGRAAQHNLLFPRGTEITRDTPPGHFNAVFLRDIEPLDTPEFLDAIRLANEQGAFVFWNHQGWKGEELGRWMDVHTEIFEKGWLHGMEVCNGGSYYPTAHRWCLEKNLTMLGTSDIHEPDRRDRSTPDNHRTMTLVFAKERTLAALQEALVEGRTAVWYQDRLIGRKPWLEAMFAGAVQVDPPHLRTDRDVWLHLRNTCDLEIRLVRRGSIGPAELKLPPRGTILLRVTAADTTNPLELAYTATNLWIAPEEGLPVVLTIPGP